MFPNSRSLRAVVHVELLGMNTNIPAIGAGPPVTVETDLCLAHSSPEAASPANQLLDLSLSVLEICEPLRQIS